MYLEWSQSGTNGAWTNKFIKLILLNILTVILGLNKLEWLRLGLGLLLKSSNN